MFQTVFIGIGAGAATALLFASVVSGSPFAIILFYLAPLPIMIAAMGWHHLAGLIAAASAGVTLAVTLGGQYFMLAFLAGVGLPAWWLSYLALLARPSNERGDMEWYPVGRLVLWAGALGCLLVVALAPKFGTDAESFRAGLAQAIERVLRLQLGSPDNTPLVLPGGTDPKAVVSLLVSIMPPTTALLTMMTLLANLWLAARVVLASGRLKRPWPALSAMDFPAPTPLGLLASVLGTALLPDLAGIFSGVVLALLLSAYTLLGFATVHSVTTGWDGRSFILTSIYLAVMVFGWTALVLAIVGLTESLIGLRAKAAAKRAGRPRADNDP